MKYYQISEINLKELLLAAHTLNALECGGVDNWTWYSESLGDYLEMHGKSYENLEEVVEDEMTQYNICTCKSQSQMEKLLDCFEEILHNKENNN